MTEIVSRLIHEAGLPVEYVLYRMEPWEIDPFLRYGWMGCRHGWEQARLVSYITAQANSTKRLKLTDVTTFPWDDEGGEGGDTRMTTEDLERLRRQAREYLERHG